MLKSFGHIHDDIVLVIVTKMEETMVAFAMPSKGTLLMLQMEYNLKFAYKFLCRS